MASYETGILNKFIKTEFIGLLEKLQNNLDDIKIRHLLEELPSKDTSQEERILLLNLIKQKKGL
ncbi:MAG: hypothetical protein HRT87_10385 [Legionellales bacterium]|nr:hypothetical protein [Legionellales bacterium]